MENMEETVLVNMDKMKANGNAFSGVYIEEFDASGKWERLPKKVSEAVSHHYGEKAEVNQIGGSGWSAGCGALKKIILFDKEHINSAVCMDGLHNGEVLKDFARGATYGKNLFVVTHSSIDPPYESTTTSASKLIWWVGGEEPKTIPDDSEYVYDHYRRYDDGDFHVMGYRGRDKSAHCSAFYDVPEILDRWVKPRGFK
jgi:hypothetical protein